MRSMEEFIDKENPGRVIQNGVPTGVELSPAMEHGGVFPSSPVSRFTTVGTDLLSDF